MNTRQTSLLSIRKSISEKIQRTLGIFSLMFVLWAANPQPLQAQCPMCKAAIESGTNYGEDGNALAEGLNIGILYLFVLPYSMILMIGIIWYRGYHRKKREDAAALLAGSETLIGSGNGDAPGVS